MIKYYNVGPYVMLSSDFEITTPFTKIICQYKERGSNYPATPKPPRKKPETKDLRWSEAKYAKTIKLKVHPPFRKPQLTGCILG